jgi:DNA-directed RNA polymerase subunit beta
VLVAEEEGDVVSVTGRQVIIRNGDGSMRNIICANISAQIRAPASTSAGGRQKGQRVRRGDVLADSSSTVNGNLALGSECDRSFRIVGRRQL